MSVRDNLPVIGAGGGIGLASHTLEPIAFIAALLWQFGEPLLANASLISPVLTTVAELGGIPGLPPGTLDLLIRVVRVLVLIWLLHRLYNRLTADSSSTS